MPPFRVRQLTVEDGLDLASWSRPGAWHIEDAMEAPEPDEGYWAVVDSNDVLLGLLLRRRRRPGARRTAATTTSSMSRSGSARNWPVAGGAVNSAAPRSVTPSDVALDRRLRTTVPEWNEVGRHAAQQAGFKWVTSQVWNHQQYDIFEQTP